MCHTLPESKVTYLCWTLSVCGAGGGGQKGACRGRRNKRGRREPEGYGSRGKGIINGSL